jgi:hypothetical protein
MDPIDGASLIAAERQRQIEQEGYSPEHDEHHGQGQLGMAAKAYLTGNGAAWPWDEESWKPTGDVVRDLVKAGALIAAEIDRLMAQDGVPRVARRIPGSPPRRLA